VPVPTRVVSPSKVADFTLWLAHNLDFLDDLGMGRLSLVQIVAAHGPHGPTWVTSEPVHTWIRTFGECLRRGCRQLRRARARTDTGKSVMVATTSAGTSRLSARATLSFRINWRTG
jgi:hypothetical protein